jgi:hypothetical protein
MRRARSPLAAGRRRWRLRRLPAGILAAIVVLLGGIWLGGHPGSLPPLLRGGASARDRNEAVTEQALNILSCRLRLSGSATRRAHRLPEADQVRR